MSLPVVCCVVVPLFVLLAPWSAGGGDREDMALSLCVRRLRVWGSPLAVCLVSLFVSVLSLVRVVIICPASTHTALVSSPGLAVLHLSTYLPTGYGTGTAKATA